MAELILEWQERMSPNGQCMDHFAKTCWTKSFNDDEYIIYEWKGGWAYSRPKHPILGEFNGRTNNLDVAKSRCKSDYISRQRLAAWHEYMISNLPPG